MTLYGEAKPPKPPLEPDGFGPSSFSMEMLDGNKVEYCLYLWVAGDGFSSGLDGGWGKSFNLKFAIPSNQRHYDVKLAVAVMMEKHRTQIEGGYGVRGAEAIIKAMCEVADGNVYRRSLTYDEIMEGKFE